MEDKIFDLLTKMYSEFTERFNQVEVDIGGLKSDIQVIKNDFVRLENKVDNGFKALFDGYIQNYEGIEEIKSTVIDISEKVERHDVKFHVLQGGKTANG